MRVEWIWFAHEAVKHRSGLIDARGIFGAVNCSEFPFQMPVWSIVFRAHFTPEEKGRDLEIEFRVVDPDGQEICWSKYDVTPPADGPPGVMPANFVLPIEWMRFLTPGKHYIRMLVDGVTVATPELVIGRRASSPGSPDLPNLDRPPMAGFD